MVISSSKSKIRAKQYSKKPQVGFKTGFPFLFYNFAFANLKDLTSVSKKLGKSTVVYYYCALSQFFFKQTLISYDK